MLVNMGRPRTHDAETGSALLAAAEQVAASEGPESLSVRRVAEEAGTTTRAVYTLFGSKDGMLVALASNGFDLLGSAVAALPVTADPVDDLVAAGLVFRRFVLDHPVLFRVGFQRDAVPPAAARQFAESQRAALRHLVARLDRLSEAGGLARVAPQEAAIYFHALCEGLAELELRGSLPSRRPATRIWREALRSLLAGLAAD